MKSFDPIGPESLVVGDPIDEGPLSYRSNAVVDQAAIATFGDETGLTKHREMLGDGRLRDARPGDDFADGRSAVAVMFLLFAKRIGESDEESDATPLATVAHG